MIAELSSQVVAALLNYKIISYEQKDIYQYGFEIMISSLITFFIVFVCGYVFKCIIPALFYFILFYLLCLDQYAEDTMHQIISTVI